MRLEQSLPLDFLDLFGMKKLAKFRICILQYVAPCPFLAVVIFLSFQFYAQPKVNLQFMKTEKERNSMASKKHGLHLSSY